MSALVFISFGDLLTDFAKDHDLYEWEILVSSSEISGSLQMRTDSFGIMGGIHYESKYDNIEFIDSLKPTPSSMESAFGGGPSSRKRFEEMYTSQLLSSDAMVDICCIVDMMLEENANILIVISDFECSARTHHVLRDFIEEEFGIIGYIYSDLKNLSDNYATSGYEKILNTSSIDVPDTFTGRNFEVITSNNITDTVGAIKENLEAQKIIAANLAASPGEEESLTSIFFNKFTETLEDKIKERLESKDIDLIKELCRQKKIRITPNATKESLIDKLMYSIKKDTARGIEYFPVK